MLFTFAGSSHSKYTNYLLEMVCSLELESSPELRDAILRSTVVNLTGKEGGFSAADFLQEFFNRLLEAIVEKKGVEYGAKFIRQKISRNLHHFARIKLDLRQAVGLAKHGGQHKAPHLKPEVVTLLNIYRETELHSRRPGRIYEDRDVDDFTRGVTKLAGGKLAQWILQTSRARNHNTSSSLPHSDSPTLAAPQDDENISDADDDSDGNTATFGYMEVDEGELVFRNVGEFIDDLDMWCGEEPEHDGIDGDEAMGVAADEDIF